MARPEGEEEHVARPEGEGLRRNVATNQTMTTTNAAQAAGQGGQTPNNNPAVQSNRGHLTINHGAVTTTNAAQVAGRDGQGGQITNNNAPVQFNQGSVKITYGAGAGLTRNSQ